MVIHKSALMLYEDYNFRIPEATMVKLEDGLRNNKEMLLTIAASHYGFRNRNWTVYRHDTVKMDIHSFVAPKPKPIIQQHRPKDSDVYGHIIAADFKYTSFYEDFAKGNKLEKLTTDEYISLMHDTILPYQRQNPMFDGLAYLELVGRLTNKEGIKKVLDREFVRVSIGAKPGRLMCSVCGQNQVEKICDHFGTKANDTFMLAESLNYEELSFVDKPADPFGRITRIHDNVCDEIQFEMNQKVLDALMDAIPMKDFFQLTDKTIVCVDNICTIINQEEIGMKKTLPAETVTFQAEFGQEKVKSVLDSLGEGIVLGDLDASTLTDRQFAIVQKADDSIKRRFPLCDAVNVQLSMALLKDAEDLSPTEYDKAFTLITKAAKKLGVEGEILVKDEADETADTVTDSDTDTTDTTDTTEVDKVKEVCDSFKALVDEYIKEVCDEEGNLKDADAAPEKPSPVTVLFAILQSYASEVKYAGQMLAGTIDSYLKELGKEAIAASTKDEIQDELQALKDAVAELEEESALLNEHNRTLNRQLRDHFVEEIVSHKAALGMADEDREVEIARYSKLGYEALQISLNDFRNMRIKIKDSTVNNNTNISTVNNPTEIADSVTDSVDDSGDSSPSTQKKTVSKEDAMDIINSLRFKNGFFIKP